MQLNTVKIHYLCPCVLMEVCLQGIVCVYVCRDTVFGEYVWPYEHVLHSCALDHGKQTLLPTCITLWHLQL